jgi:hypothetical protein
MDSLKLHARVDEWVAQHHFPKGETAPPKGYLGKFSPPKTLKQVDEPERRESIPGEEGSPIIVVASRDVLPLPSERNWKEFSRHQLRGSRSNGNHKGRSRTLSPQLYRWKSMATIGVQTLKPIVFQMIR